MFTSITRDNVALQMKKFFPLLVAYSPQKNIFSFLAIYFPQVKLFPLSCWFAGLVKPKYFCYGHTEYSVEMLQLKCGFLECE